LPCNKGKGGLKGKTQSRKKPRGKPRNKKKKIENVNNSSSKKAENRELGGTPRENYEILSSRGSGGGMKKCNITARKRTLVIKK